MKIEKLPSGSYRIRQQYHGRRYNITFDHKPSQKEINIALAERMSSQGDYSAPEGTLEQYANKYLAQSKKDGKSPSTIKGYSSIKKNTPIWFKRLDLNKTTEADFQKVVDEYYETHSSKSTRLFYSFWHSISAEYRPYLALKVKLPDKEKKVEYQPSTKDVKRILEYAKESRYYLVLRLASIGLRRGEACAITSKDLNEDNILTINKDMIIDENNKQIIKPEPKTMASNRRILIASDIADLIRQQETVFDGNMHTINEYLHKCQDALEIPRFRLHILRHFAAAYMLKKGFTVVQIEDYLGWEHGSSVMQKVYSYNLDPEDSQKDIASIFSDLVEG